jgi:hypothetical protein
LVPSTVDSSKAYFEFVHELLGSQWKE